MGEKGISLAIKPMKSAGKRRVLFKRKALPDGGKGVRKGNELTNCHRGGGGEKKSYFRGLGPLDLPQGCS